MEHNRPNLNQLQIQSTHSQWFRINAVVIVLNKLKNCNGINKDKHKILCESDGSLFWRQTIFAYGGAGINYSGFVYNQVNVPKACSEVIWLIWLYVYEANSTGR